jgi:hypothetical protein
MMGIGAEWMVGYRESSLIADEPQLISFITTNHDQSSYIRHKICSFFVSKRGLFSVDGSATEVCYV